jgi:photosystem II stability/assembly factor-like uncharacterized protein
MTTTPFTTPGAPATRHPRRAPACIAVRAFAGALVAGALLTAPLHADWRPVGPYGGTVTVLAVDPARPSTILAGTPHQGLFRSDDGGMTWEPVDTGIETLVSQIAFDRLHPGRVYAGIGGGVLLSLDHGRSWSDTTAFGGHAGLLTAMAVDPRGGSFVYASAAELFRSADRGRHWKLLGSASPAQNAAAALAVDATSSALYSASYAGIYRSRDHGVTFALLGLAGLDPTLLALAPSNPAVIYAGGDQGLFRSTDRGAHWQEIDAGLPNQAVTAVAVHPAHPATLYAAVPAVDGGSAGGLFESVDGGAHWTALGAGLPAGEVISLAIDPAAPSRVYAGLTKDGVFSSADAGAHWSWANAGIRTLRISNLAVGSELPGTVYARSGENGLYRSSDAGLTWQLVDARVGDIYAGIGGATVALDPRRTATVYAGIPGLLERSDDGGRSWTRIDTGVFDDFSQGTLALDPHQPSTLYAGGYGTFSKSTDRGDTWSAPRPFSATCSLQPTFLVVSPAPPFEVWASGGSYPPCTDSYAAGLQVSGDGGANWVRIGQFMKQVVPDPANSSVVYALDYFYHLLKSTNGGWIFAPPGDAGRQFFPLVIDPVTPSRLYAGVVEVVEGIVEVGGVVTSDDGGVTWQQLGGDIDGLLLSLAIDPNVPGRLWAGTDRSVFVFDP